MASVNPSSNDGALTRYYTKVLSEAEKEKQAQVKRIIDNSERELKQVEDSYKAALEKTTQESETTAKNVRADSQQAIALERDHSRESLDQLKEQLYNQRGQYEGDRAAERRTLDAFINDTLRRKELDQRSTTAREKDFIDKMDEVSHNNDEKFKEFQASQLAASDTSKQNTRKLMNEIQKQTEEQAEKNADRSLEQQDLARRELRQLNQSYQTQLDRLDKNLKNSEQHYSAQAEDTVAQKDRQYTDLFKSQNTDHTHELKNLENSFNAYTENARQNAKENDERQSQIIAKQSEENAIDKETVLKEQGKSYRTSATEQRKADQDTIGQLERALQTRKTSPDVSLISPSAEEGLRNALSKNFEKSFAVEREKNQRVTGDLYEKNVTELREAREDFQDQLTKTNRDFVRSQAADRSDFYGGIQDAESDTNFKLQDMESQNSRQIETLHRHYGRLLDKQKKENDNSFESARVIAQNKINEMRQETDSAVRAAHKDYAAKSNTLIQNYEKKFMGQKEDYEIKIDDIKTQNAAELRTAEQNFKLELEANNKSNEAKLAQYIAQSNERERKISQNFADELDRTRRSYELVIQKKS